MISNIISQWNPRLSSQAIEFPEDSSILSMKYLESISPIFLSDKDVCPSSSSSESLTSTSMESDAFSGIYFDDTDKANYADSSFNDKDDDMDEDDEESCDSTVINGIRPGLVRPPPTVSKEEQARFYWDLCYGNSIPTKRCSTNRFVPKKSCFPAKKITPWSEIAARRNTSTPLMHVEKEIGTLEESKNLSMVTATPMITTPCKQAEESGTKKC